MFYEECPAPPGLQPFVTQLWFVRAQPQARYEKILPGPEAHLILNLSDPYRLITPAVRNSQPSRNPGNGSFHGLLCRPAAQLRHQRKPGPTLQRWCPPDSLWLGSVHQPAAVGISEPCGGCRKSSSRAFRNCARILATAEPEQAFAALATFLEAQLRPGYTADPRTREGRRNPCQRGRGNQRACGRDWGSARPRWSAS